MAACTECRRRKLRCSTERPSCKECRRLGAECVYEVRKSKPGVKSGAVENLNRRVDKLEKLLQQSQQQTESALRSCLHWNNRDGNSRTASDLLFSFERELKRFNNNIIAPQSFCGTACHDQPTPSSRSSTSPIGNSPEVCSVPTQLAPDFQRKRRCLNSRSVSDGRGRVPNVDFKNTISSLPPGALLEAVIDAYFSQVHPWIPMLHEASFRQRLSDEEHESKLEVILHAMVVAALRFVDTDITIQESYMLQLAKQSRDWVMLNGMNSLSVENLQGLTIVAFDDIGKGDAANAWSAVGSLTRTVEYLQLSIEVEPHDEQPLLKPCPSLPPPKSWTEIEERRRVFWNIFNLDRFCSVITGWNTSLTSDDVQRRLPADGVLWRKREPVLTPYFGIWDKSAGRIGNSIAFLPVHHPSPTQSAGGMHQSPAANAGFEGTTPTAGMSTIGAFAYCIEATESMSRVTTYFLQQKINLHDQKQIGSWLTRFKELDLRLVHWKMFLPQKWKDTNISRQSTEVIMDPNLTLAHITHNASMILLHQLIAYPPADWDWGIKLPSSCSAETCQAAAVETANISQNYLGSTIKSRLVNSQFIFCVFVAARVLLVHWRHHNNADLLPEFMKLVQSLDVISCRWAGRLGPQTMGPSNLAGKYACQLRRMHEKYTNNPSFRVDVLGYANELSTTRMGIPCATTIDQDHEPDDEPHHMNRSKTHTRGLADGGMQSYVQVEGGSDMLSCSEQTYTMINNHPEAAISESSATHRVPCPTSQALTLSPAGFAPAYQPREHINASPAINPASSTLSINDCSATGIPPTGISAGTGNDAVIDDLTAISRMFFDQQYLEMDRVIGFDDVMFTSNMEWWGPGSQ